MAVEARSGWITAAALVLGCSGASPPPAAATTKAAASGVARYLPLEDGTVFSYETTTEPAGERGLLVLEVRRPRADAATLVVAGRATPLSVGAHAVAHAAGGFFLSEPLVVGAEWHGDFGHVRVTRVGARVTVPAGTFDDCVETVEELSVREGAKRTTTTFCAGVGITSRATEVEQDGEHQSERIALKSFGKRFDPSSAATTNSR
jgi:hypothetical protein